MSKVIPFAALIPTAEVASSMLAPPYDVVTVDQARAIVRDNPHSFLHISRSEVDLDPSISPYDDSVYQRATATLRQFEERGYLVHAEPRFYVYRAEMGGHAQAGLVCGASVDEYENGAIKRHERTREEKVVDRTRHACMAQAHTEPVMLVHRASEAINHLIVETETRGEPLFDVVDNEGVRHQLWPAANTVAIQHVFDGIDALYIADGHHRSEAAARVRDHFRRNNPTHTGQEAYNYFPVVIFPHDVVRIFAYDWKGDPADRPLSTYSMEDVMKLADEGGIMPPKSTWFAPKLASGLFIYTM